VGKSVIFGGWKRLIILGFMRFFAKVKKLLMKAGGTSDI
jgi:hypothetical protein